MNMDQDEKVKILVSKVKKTPSYPQGTGQANANIITSEMSTVSPGNIDIRPRLPIQGSSMMHTDRAYNNRTAMVRQSMPDSFRTGN